jgi:antitoxin ParD1/3/4
VLTEQREGIEEAKLQALKQAANQVWSAIEAGRYPDVDDGRLEDFVARLAALEASAKYLAPDASTKSIPSEP